MRTAALRIAAAATGILVAADLAVFFFGDRIGTLIENAKAGCFPWSPAEIDYRPGMTICPGQTVRVQIIITVPTTPLPSFPENLPEGRRI